MRSHLRPDATDPVASVRAAGRGGATRRMAAGTALEPLARPTCSYGSRGVRHMRRLSVFAAIVLLRSRGRAARECQPGGPRPTLLGECLRGVPGRLGHHGDDPVRGADRSEGEPPRRLMAAELEAARANHSVRSGHTMTTSCRRAGPTGEAALRQPSDGRSRHLERRLAAVPARRRRHAPRAYPGRTRLPDVVVDHPGYRRPRVALAAPSAVGAMRARESSALPTRRRGHAKKPLTPTG